MCFNREEAIFTVNYVPLKLVDNFMHLSSSISSTECDVSIHLVKAWTASDHTGVWCIRWNKTRFLLSSDFVSTTLWMHHMDADKTHSAKVRLERHKNVASYIEQVLEATPHKTTAPLPITK